MLEIKQIVTGILEENCYLIYNESSLLVIDPGSEAEKIATEIDQLGRRPLAILLTHTHYDHIGAVTEIREKYQIPVYVSSLEQDWLRNSGPDGNGSSTMADYGITEIIVEPAEHEFKLKEYDFAGMKFRVVATPGHSHGSVSFIFPNFAVVGDTLFKGSIGRSDFYTGDYDTLIESITTELFSLPDETRIYPGHREATTIGYEKATNPYFN